MSSKAPTVNKNVYRDWWWGNNAMIVTWFYLHRHTKKVVVLVHKQFWIWWCIFLAGLTPTARQASPPAGSVRVQYIRLDHTTVRAARTRKVMMILCCEKEQQYGERFLSSIFVAIQCVLTQWLKKCLALKWSMCSNHCSHQSALSLIFTSGICAMCGKKVLDTKNYKQTSVWCSATQKKSQPSLL